MITKWIVDAFLAGLDALLSLLPSFTVPTWDNPNGALGQVANLNRVFPVCTLILCILAVVVVMLALYAWDALVFVYHQFWGSN